MGCAQPPPTLSVGQTTSLSQQTSYWSLYCSRKRWCLDSHWSVCYPEQTFVQVILNQIPEIYTIICRVSPFLVPFTITFSFSFFFFRYLMSRQTGQKLLITRRLLQSFRCQPVGRDLTFSLLYEYAYKSTANPFEQDSCKLGSVVLEGD